MKFLIITFQILITFLCSAQPDSLKTGDKWQFEHPFVSSKGKSFGTYFFREGLCEVRYNKKVGFIDTSYIVVISFRFVEVDFAPAYKFVNSRSIAFNGNKLGVIDTNGNTIISYEYDEIRKFESYYYVSNDLKKGYIDSTGEIVIPIYNNWSTIPFRTNIEIEKQIEKLKLEEKVHISREKALEIAKESRYFNKPISYTPLIQLNFVNKEWIINTTKVKGTTHNGRYSIHIYYQIIIDAENGRIKKKRKRKERHPTYNGI